MEKNNWKAFAKIGGGMYETASGILAIAGHGIAGTIFRRLHATQAAMRYANTAVRQGVKMMDEGMNELKW
jgi:hypothetical protein